jgi:hypothetical protein
MNCLGYFLNKSFKIHSVGCTRIYQMALFPFRNPRFRSNWRRFLGLKRGKRTFFWHILFPSSHEARDYAQWDGTTDTEEGHGLGMNGIGIGQQRHRQEEEDERRELLSGAAAGNGTAMLDV